LSRENTELLLTTVMNNCLLGVALWSRRGQPYFGHSGANGGFRSTMVAHVNGGCGVVVMTNGDNGSDLHEVILELIGKQRRLARLLAVW
jgi:hypothetical protein